ncbi:MAG TPA: response regulator [Polyangiales bacterium]|nr:response regulator [Polyangiales bacterium]
MCSDVEPRTARVLRVLLVEDNLEDAEFVIDELRRAGYAVEYERVDTACALRAALSGAHWQLVLCDYSMPQLDALSALEIVKELRLDLPFIVVSGVIGEEAAIAAMQCGAHDFVLKHRLARLAPAVERELREAAVRRERKALQEQLLLSDRLVQIGTLAAGVAHEINNPLAYVIGNLTLALQELAAPELSRTAKGNVEDALRQALEGTERIRATTEDLRVFSRNDDGKPRPVDLQRVLDSSIGMAWTQIRHRARLVKDFEPVPPVAANENRLGQVFLNLLINAAQAIPDGSAADNEIRVSLRASNCTVEIRVSDTGVGIAPELEERLFEPFFTTKPKDVGTGLGLSISRQIVREYQGDIDAHCNSGRGMTFRVRLPTAQFEAPRSSAPLADTRGPRRGRVMVIDDEVALVNTIVRMLRPPHDVSGFTDARRALAHLANDSDFDVIVCDLMMPQLSSIEFYAELLSAHPALIERVVFMTGGAFTATAQKFLASLSNPRLQKPFHPEALTSLVDQLIARHDPARHVTAVA